MSETGSALEAQHGDGPVAGWLAAVRLPVAAVPVVLLAAVVGVGGAWLAPGGWAWALGGVALALCARMGRSGSRLGWTVPALLRTLEYGVVLALVGDTPWGYALLAAVAFHHYDIVYRARTRGARPPRWLIAVTGGWEGRTTVVAGAAALGLAEPVVAVLAPVLAVVLIAEASAGWITHRPAVGR